MLTVFMISASPRGDKNGYIRIVQTSTKDDSVTVFFRPTVPSGYAVKISDWFSNNREDLPNLPRVDQGSLPR